MTLNKKINLSSFNKNKEVSHMKLKENNIQMSGRKWFKKKINMNMGKEVLFYSKFIHKYIRMAVLKIILQTSMKF